MADARNILKNILAKRLETMTVEDAAELEQQLADVPTVDVIRLYSLVRGVAAETPAPSPVARPNMSLKEALVEVMRAAERPLTSNEIVARVIALRPGSPDPSIRSEISRARKLGAIVLRGDPRGGTYTLAPVARSTRAPLT